MTDYLRIAQERAQSVPEQEDNPYLPLARESQQSREALTRTVIEQALKDDPEIAAERQRIAQSSGVPIRVVERNLEALRIKERARSIDLASMASESPVLYRQLVDPNFTTTAVDDLPTLKKIERGVQGGLAYVMGADGKGGLPQDLKIGLFNRGAQGTAGVFRAIAELLAPLFDVLEGVEAIGGNPLRRLAEGFGQIAERNAAIANDSPGVFGVSSGVQSLGQNAKYLPLAMLGPAGASAALTGMVLESFGASYQKARGQGVSELGSMIYGASDGAIEYATEKLPLSRLIKDVQVGETLIKTIGRQMAVEIPGEQLATILQDMNEWAVLNPEKPFRDYLNERPSAAAETLIATVIGTGGNVALVKSIDAGLNGLVQRQLAALDTARLDHFQEQLQDAGASLLRERSPEQFRKLVQTAVDENPGTQSEIFVDGGVLNQLPAELLAQLPDSVREQIADAVESNGTVSIPMADVLTIAPGTPLEQVLNDNARLQPDALSRVEVQQADAQQAEWIKTEAQRVLQDAQDQGEWAASTEAVKTAILADLNTAGRFSTDAHEVKATLAAQMISVMAGRSGMTPEQFHARYPLRTGAVTPGVGSAVLGLEQGGETLADVRQQWADAGIENFISERDGVIHLSQIVVPKDSRGAGKGTAAMQALISYADRTGQRITLTPSADFGGSKKRLVEFYKRFGFVQNKGKDKDFTTMEGMYREPQSLSQTDDPAVLSKAPRGTFNPQTFLITLNENADLTTFEHELGHYALEVMADIASQPDAPPQVAEDMGKLLKWFGVADLPAWNAMTLDQKRPHHERLAESMEQYFFEGKAPSVELQPVFRRLRTWFVHAYQTLTHFLRGRNLKLSDEVRQVFDRMLATDEQIAQAEQTAGMLPDFEATNEAIEKLQARSLKDLRWTIKARSKALRELTKQANELRKAVEAEVTAEVNALPEVRAKEAIDELRKSTPEYKKALADWKKDRADALQKAKEDVTANLLTTEGAGLEGLKKGQFLSKNKRRIANEAEGRALEWERANPKPQRELVNADADLAMVADQTGYTSVDEMLLAIDALGSKSDLIDSMTDRRMLERHSDISTPEAREQAATEAIHNEARARSLATELKTQQDALNPRRDTGETNAKGSKITVNAITEAARQFAQDLASRRRLKDLKAAAAQHRAAEARAGKRWQQATVKGETQEAVQAKRDQVLNNFTVIALQEAQAEARKILEFFRSVTKGSNEKTVQRGRDPDVVNAMRAILAAYDVAPRLEKSALEYMEVVSRSDPAMYGVLKPSVDAAMINAKPLTDMTMEELRGLNDELQAMWNLAKRSRQMEVAGTLMDIEDAEQELSDRLTEVGIPATMPGESGAMTPKEEAKRKLQFAGSLLRRVEQWAEGMDGKYGGPFLRLVFQPVKEAANRYRSDRLKYRKAYQALLDKVASSLKKGEIAAPELGYTFGKGHNGIGHAELLHAILHTGNESNKRKLLLGRKWATENPDGTLNTAVWDGFIKRMQDTGVLAKEHYDFAQGVWDLLEETKPLAQKTHRDVFGRYFDEVTADAFDTPYGAYRGGYVPAQADPRIVQDADLRKLAEAENESMAFSFPSTNKGFTKGRVEYNRPLMLDLRTIGQHLDKVLLFSHMESPVRDVNKLLTRKGVSDPLGRIDPTIYAGMLTPWLSRSARQIVETPIVGDGGISRALSAARNRAGMSLMFANISNTLQQTTGFVTAFSKLKKDDLHSSMMKASAQFIANPRKMAGDVAAASDFMADRMKNEIAAINNAIDDILIDQSLYQQAQGWAQKHAYFLQTAFANTMEPIIWTAGYNGALGKGMSDAEATRYADGLIRQTQGSTLPEDVSRLETGPAYARLFTQFVGYFNMMANTNATGLKQIAQDVGLKKGAGKALALVTTGMLVPLWVAEAIAVAMRGGPEDEDDDGYLDDWLAAVFGMGTIKGGFAMVPFVGQLANAAINRFNSNPADDKVSLSPAVSLLEASAGVPSHVYKAITGDADKINKRNAVRDVASALSIATGLPFYAAARPLGYLAGIADDRIDPAGPVDTVRGLATGAASPQSR